MPEIFGTGRGGVETQIVVDTDEAERFFEYSGYRARDMREPLYDSGEKLISHIEDTFWEEGANVGNPWPEVSEDWRKAKDKKGGTAIFLLRFTDDLINAATSRKSLYWGTGDALIYEVDIDYADVHQEGASFVTPTGGYAEIPPRPFVVVTEELEMEVTDIFYDWLERLHNENARRSKGGGSNPLAFRGILDR